MLAAVDVKEAVGASRGAEFEAARRVEKWEAAAVDSCRAEDAVLEGVVAVEDVEEGTAEIEVAAMAEVA